MKQTIRYSILIFFAIFMMLPMWYMVVTSLKPFAYVMSFPPQLYPVHATLQNYIEAIDSNNFGVYFANSLYVAITATILGTFIGCLAAFALSRFRFAGAKAILSLLVGSMMIPGMTFIVPQFMMMKHFGLLDSLFGLILIYAAGSIPFTTFLIKGFFDEIPNELQESVLIDGGNRWVIFSRVMMPVSLPAVITAMILNFMGNWDEFTLALTFINDPAKRTLPIAIRLFQGVHSTDWGLIFAASIIAIVPMIVVFISFQRFIVKSITGAVKG